MLASAGSDSTCGLQLVPQQRLRFGLVRAVDADLGLEDGNEPGGRHARAVLELLLHDRRHPVPVRVLDHRAHLGAEDPMPIGPLEQLVEGVNRLHELDALPLVGKSLVDLQEGDDLLLLPKVLRCRETLHVPFHRLLEQDRREDARAVEGSAGEHPRPHRVDEVEHLPLGAVPAPRNAILGQRLGRAAATLVEGCEEPLTRADLLQLRHVHD